MSFHHTETYSLISIFRKVIGKLPVFLLLISMVVLPTAPVFASEEISESETIESGVVDDEEVVPAMADNDDEVGQGVGTEDFFEEDAAEEEVMSSESDNEVVVEDAEGESNSPATTTSDVLDEDSNEENDVVSPEDGGVPESDEDIATTTDTLSDNASTTADVVTDENEQASTTPDVAEDVATTTDPIGDVAGTSTSTEDGTGEEAGADTDEATTTDDGVSDEESTSAEEQDEEGDDFVENAEDDDDVIEDNGDSEADSASSTEPNVYEADVQNIVYNDENKYLFSKNECISVGDGAFYCTEEEVSEVNSGTDGIYAKVDEDGDREIYIEQGGEIVQITDNLVDDDAPFYDEVSNTVVWHRSIDGRYQVIEYDFETKEERQLTFERYNNMQPSRYGDVLVWQGWVGNDWEIMLEIDGELSMITDNQVHDISPRINGNYIIWQSLESDVWQVKIYDTDTGITESISDDNGGAVENPRFVLVYDTKFDNGDVETKGYDLESGQVVPLSSTPAPVPENIPSPDPTEEDRAMVQPLVQIKTKTEGDDFDLDPVDFDPVDDDTIATTTDDVVIEAYSDSDGHVASTTDAGNTSSATTVDYIEDLDLTTQYAEEDEDTIHIEDVIITPFTEEISTTTDSQVGVATST